MTKTMEAVLLEHYADFDPLFHPFVQDDGDGQYFRRDLWRESLGEAPTDEQLVEWMSE